MGPPGPLIRLRRLAKQVTKTENSTDSGERLLSGALCPAISLQKEGRLFDGLLKSQHELTFSSPCLPYHRREALPAGS
jgi:hypothetical protein